MHVLLVDNEALSRQSLKFYIEHAVPDLRVSETGRVTVAEKMASGGGVDLMVLDREMRCKCGSPAFARLRRNLPDVPTLLIWQNPRNRDVRNAMANGLSGVIPKTLPVESFVGVLRLVLAGERYFPATALVADDSAPVDRAGPVRDEERESLFGDLTPRQRDVLMLLMEAHSNREIGARLGIKEVTVKLHLHGLYRKLGVTKRLEAVKLAMAHGYNT